MKATFISASLAATLVFPSAAQSLTAQVEANGYSFSLAPVVTSNSEIVHFTSYDGLSGTPLLECDAVSCYAGEEFRPASLGSNSFAADYLVADSLGIYEYGTVLITASAPDGDGNGQLDALERLRPGNFSISGTTYPDWNYFGLYYNSSISASIVRSAGNLEGNVSGIFSNPAQTASFTGDSSLSGANGPVSYEIGGDSLLWTLSQLDIDGTYRTFIGSSAINRNGTTSIEVPGFALYDSASGTWLYTNTATLDRDGFVFRGIVELVDGGPFTSWADYKYMHVEVTDNNDTDSDGLPDLVSLPEPEGLLMLASGVMLLMTAGRRRILP
jgi:hypothetical protein